MEKLFGVFVLLIFIGMGYVLYHSLSSSHEEIITPNGKQGVRAHCPMDSADCYTEAGKVCKNGYTILDEHYTAMVAECK